MYVGKGAACVQNGEVKTFKRKVRKALRFTELKECKYSSLSSTYLLFIEVKGHVGKFVSSHLCPLKYL